MIDGALGLFLHISVICVFIYSMVLIFILFRYGKSKLVGTLVSAAYLAVLLSIYVGVVVGLDKINL